MYIVLREHAGLKKYFNFWSTEFQLQVKIISYKITAT